MRAPQMADFTEWSALREVSRDFLTPWEPTWPADDLTRGAFRRRLKRYAEDLRTDQAYPFFLFRKDDNVLVGGLTLSNIRRGVAQAGSLGYWTGAPFARRGHMTAAVRALIPFAFSVLRLHRLEAACIPTNVRRSGCSSEPALAGRAWLASTLYQRGVAGPSALCAAQRRHSALRPCLGRAMVRLL